MEEIIARIKEYALVRDPSLTDENGLLDLIVNEVVDRALAFMNRDQLVAQYELDLLDDDVEEADYVLPIPVRIERALASTVVALYKTTIENTNSSLGAITSISDNGQSISYATKAASFFSSSDDSEVFSGISGLMRRYILPTIPKNENTGYLQNYGREPFL